MSLGLPVTDIGFTGTRKGMTPLQRSSVSLLIQDLHPQNAHLGDCTGVDEQVRAMLEEFFPHIQRIGHPPKNNKTRAWGSFDVLHPEKDYEARDKDIVKSSSVLIAVPKGFKEEMRGSGTWLTVRYARKQDCMIQIVYPDGRVATE